MPSDRSLVVSDVLRAYGAAAKGGRYLFLEFVQPQEGSEPHRIALPVSIAHKLVQVAFQGVAPDQRHALLASLVPYLEEPEIRDDGRQATPAYLIDGFEIGTAEDGAVIVSFEISDAGRLSFNLGQRRFSLKFARAVREATRKPVERMGPQLIPQHPFLSVAEDIEWLRDEWAACEAAPTTAELRRASGTLRRLLLNDGLRSAWRYCGLPKSPSIIAPDLKALMQTLGQQPEHTVSVLAGGIEIDGISCACMSQRRVFNPSTGMGPDAESGFAVEVGHISRKVIEGVSEIHDPEWQAIRHEWKSIESYMNAPGAFRRGTSVSRRSILTYFANYSGGVHLDLVKGRPEDAAVYQLHRELDGRADILGVDGLHGELLAMGQAIGGSPDTLKLASIIREAAERDAQPFTGVGFGIRVSGGM